MPGGTSIGVGLIVGAGAAATALAQINPLASGERLGAMSAPGILGVVCVAAVVGVVMLYRDGQQQRKAEDARRAASEKVLRKLVEDSTAASQRMADSADAMSKVGVELKDCVNRCAAVQGVTLPRGKDASREA